MSDTRYLLDTSAVLTFIEDEAGADRVEALLRHEAILLPFPVLLETHYISAQKQSEDVADRHYALLKQLSASFICEIDEPTLLTASRYKAAYHISLTDALIAAFAAQAGAVLVHKDPEYEALRQELNQEILPYKR